MGYASEDSLVRAQTYVSLWVQPRSCGVRHEKQQWILVRLSSWTNNEYFIRLNYSTGNLWNICGHPSCAGTFFNGDTVSLVVKWEFNFLNAFLFFAKSNLLLCFQVKTHIYKNISISVHNIHPSFLSLASNFGVLMTSSILRYGLALILLTGYCSRRVVGLKIVRPRSANVLRNKDELLVKFPTGQLFQVNDGY